MPKNRYPKLLFTSSVDGTAVTAAAATTLLPTSAKILLPASFFSDVGDGLYVRASGRISNVVTTPGTARFDLKTTGPTGTVVTIFDSLAMNLNIVAKTNVHWELEINLWARVLGAAGQLFPGPCSWMSESVIGSPLPTVGGSGKLLIPVATAPALGTAFDMTVPQYLDLQFTQTVATGSCQLHNYEVWQK